MSKTLEEKNEIKAQKFITQAKKEFEKLIPRDTIGNVAVTECVEEGGSFKITGSVGTVSPTKKQKTFKYSATVNVDDDGKCALADLQVTEL